MTGSNRAARLAAMAALAAIVGACASTQPAVEPPPAAPSAPMPVAGLDWHFTDDADEARLAYGVAVSDEMKLGLVCRPGAGRLSLIGPGPKGAEDIYVESGGETGRYPAEVEPDDLLDGVFLTASAQVDEPVFLRFKALGWLAQWRGNAREIYVVHPASVDGVRRFFDRCG